MPRDVPTVYYYETPKHWKQWLSSAEIWYNSCLHSYLGCSPSERFLDMNPTSLESKARTWVIDRDTHMQLLKEYLAKAQHEIARAIIIGSIDNSKWVNKFY